MLGDFITRVLVLILGYTYPAFECFKTVEKNKVDIEELRFWCQYWILVALITSFERVGDIFISWLPFYGEMKVIFFIYLWYPKTKGSRYIYGTFFRPYIAQHETEIDRKIMEMRARAWDFIAYYWQNCAQAGQSSLAQAFQFVLTQSIRFSNPANQQKVLERNANANANTQPEPEPEPEPEAESDSEMRSQPAPRPLNKTLASFRSFEKQPSRGKKWPPPTPPPTPGRDSPRTPSVHGNDAGMYIPDTIPGSPITEARAKLRRTASKS